MDIVQFLQSLLTGNIGTVILVIVLYKTGVLQYVINLKKNGNGKDNTEVLTAIEKLGTNHILHSKDELLEEIRTMCSEIKAMRSDMHEHTTEERQVWDKVYEGVIYLKAKANGK